MAFFNRKGEGEPGVWLLRCGLLAVAIVVYAAYGISDNSYISGLLVSVLVAGIPVGLAFLLLCIFGSISYARMTNTPRRIVEQRVAWIRGDWRGILGGSLLIAAVAAGLAAAFLD